MKQQSLLLLQHMDEPINWNQQKQLKLACLDRDNFRCMATGLADELAPDSEDDPFYGTELAHTVPFSLATWKSTDGVWQFPFHSCARCSRILGPSDFSDMGDAL